MMINGICQLDQVPTFNHAWRSRADLHHHLVLLLKWLTLAALVGALVHAQLKPRFMISTYSHYGWPFVHVVRHVDIMFNEPMRVYYVPFMPGLAGDLLAWTFLIACTALVLKPWRRNSSQVLQVRVSTLLWMITVAAILLAIYRAEPRDFWVRNRILHLEPGVIQAALFLGLSCVIYVATRCITQLCWHALAPYVAQSVTLDER
jgi:hypothetical protein